MKRVYVVWQDANGGFHNDTYNIDKPLNHNIIIEEIREYLSYDRKYDFIRLISWQEEENNE